MPGTWYERTAQYEADRRGKDVDPRAFTSDYELELEPLPCWAHLSAREYRGRVAEIVHDIEVETACRIFLTGKVPLGARISASSPLTSRRTGRRSRRRRSATPSPRVREQLREAYRLFVEAYREAAEKLRAGDRSAEFPEGCFQPALPFVPFSDELPPTRAGPGAVPS